MTPKPRVTDPAPKYGPTPDYGGCEAADCHAPARVTCRTCDGHFCRGHADHDNHVSSNNR